MRRCVFLVLLKLFEPLLGRAAGVFVEVGNHHPARLVEVTFRLLAGFVVFLVDRSQGLGEFFFCHRVMSLVVHPGVGANAVVLGLNRVAFGLVAIGAVRLGCQKPLLFPGRFLLDPFGQPQFSVNALRDAAKQLLDDLPNSVGG